MYHNYTSYIHRFPETPEVTAEETKQPETEVKRVEEESASKTVNTEETKTESVKQPAEAAAADASSTGSSRGNTRQVGGLCGSCLLSVELSSFYT